MKSRLITFLIAASIAASAADKLLLLPQPKKVEQKDGDTFVITKATKIVLTARNAKADKLAAEMLADEIRSAADIKVPTSAATAGAKAIVLRRLDAKDFPKLESNDAERFK